MYATSNPNTFVDISTTFEDNIEALSFHKSQFPEEAFELMKSSLCGKSKDYVELVGCGTKISTTTLSYSAGNAQLDTLIKTVQS
jgi:hypothetical protein